MRVHANIVHGRSFNKGNKGKAVLSKNSLIAQLLSICLLIALSAAGHEKDNGGILTVLLQNSPFALQGKSLSQCVLYGSMNYLGCLALPCHSL